MDTMLDRFNWGIVALFALVIGGMVGWRVWEKYETKEDKRDLAIERCASHTTPESCLLSVNSNHDVCFEASFSLWPGRGMKPRFHEANYMKCIENGVTAIEGR